MASLGATALSAVDITICVLYLVSVLLVGVFFTVKEQRERRKAQQQQQQQLPKRSETGSADGEGESNHEVLEEYYLGGRRIPWWALAIADVSSYIDISGTMINTALVYALGIRGMYIELRGGLCLFMAFQLAYTGKLSRRCPVKTRGEWIKFRFGDRREGVLLRTLIACTSLVTGTLMVTYFAVGGGKFVTEFVNIPAYGGLPSEFWAAAVLMEIAVVYTIASGFTTVVYTDVYQSLFMFTSFLIVAVMGLGINLPETFAIFVPDKTLIGPPNLIAMNVTKSEWLSAMPLGRLHLPEESAYAMYNDFSTLVVTYLVIQCMRSASGPGGSGLQTVLATKSEKEVRSQTFLAMLLLALRWAFSGGIAVMAIHYTIQHEDYALDPERVVPIVLHKMLPVGVKGFVLASLLAAALTTFDTTVNATSSYWTVDIYQALLKPDASEKELLWNARISTVVIMVVGLLLSLHVDTINRIWGFITIAMGGAFVFPYFLSWYWSRFNAYGCLFGILSGFLASLVIFTFDPMEEELTSFFVTSSISLGTALVVCKCTKPVPSQVTRRFYRFARPPGRWHAVKSVCFASRECHEIDQENHADLACTILIGIAQLSLYLLSVSIVAKAWTQSLVLAGILAVVSPWIYLKWFIKLQDRPVGLLRSDLNAELLESH